MNDSGGRARADAAQEAAERAAAVAAMLDEADAKGWVAVGRDAVDFIPPDDKQFTEVVEGGHEWARYTARVKGGGVYQEGGARRALYTTDKKARKLLSDKAGALTKETRLFTLLEDWRRARSTRGEGLTVAATLWSDDKLRKALEDRIRERAGVDEESGNIRRSEHLEILAELGVDDDTIRRLKGDRTVRADEAKAASLVTDEEEFDHEAALAEALAAAAARKDTVVLKGANAPFVAQDDPDAEQVLETPDTDWAYAVLLKDKDVHLEGGLRRERHTTKKTAEKLVTARVERLLGETDLRTLIWLRASLRTAEGEWSAEARIASDAALRKRLDEAICAVAPDYEASPPLRESQADELAAAGVDEATIRRLTHDRTVDPGEAKAAALHDEDEVDPASALAEALAAAHDRKDTVVLEGTDAPYVGRDDPNAEQVIDAPDSEWAYAVVLKGGDVHLEGGLRRERHTTRKTAEALVQERIEALLAESDLRVLLWLRNALSRATGEWNAEARIAADPALRERLDEAIRTVAPSFEARPLFGMEQGEVLAEAGVDDATMERLVRPEARAALTAAAARAAAVAYTAWRPRKVTTVRAAAEERVAKGYVWLSEEAVPYLDAHDRAIRQRLAARPDWSTHAVVLDDDSLHIEGGAVRQRLVPEEQVAPLLEAAADRLAECGDLHSLLDIAAVLVVGPAEGTVASVFARDAKRRKALEKRIHTLTADEWYTGRVLRKLHRDALIAVGVDDEVLERVCHEDIREPLESAT